MSKIRNRIHQWAETCLFKIPQAKIKHAGFSLLNGACHFNAVAALRSGRADKVWLVWAGGKNGVVHFINSKSGMFFDETWHDYENQSYHIIRMVKPDEFNDIGDLLNQCKRHLINQHGSMIDKLKMRLGHIHGTI